MAKNNFLGILFRFVPFLVVMMISMAFSNTSVEYENTIDNSFEISNLSVEVTATSDRLAYVKETIDVDFNEPRSAIIRDIPCNGGLEIRDIVVHGRAFSVTKYGDFLSVDMDADNYTPSLQSRQYIISYTIDYSKAITKNIQAKDSIPLNVVGLGWPTIIHNAAIHITLPEAPTASYYYVGVSGTSTGASRLNVVSSGKTITITTLDTLQPFEGITVGYDMPSGIMKSYVNTNIIWNILIGGILLIILYVVFYSFGRDQIITPVVNFTAPMGLNPAEAGYLIDGNCTPMDLTSLIYFWAAQGHLNIKDDGKNIELVKISELDNSHRIYEKSMFSALFKSMRSVKINSLKETYYPVIISAQNQIRSDYSGKLYKTQSFVASIIMLLIASLATVAWVTISGHAVSAEYNNTRGYLAIAFSIAVYIIGTLMLRYEPKLLKSKSKFYMTFVAADLMIAFIFFLLLKGSFIPLIDSIIISTFLGIVMAVIPFIQCRSNYYNNVLNELLGFRNFINSAEKERLELLLKDNPSYYYDILPYANVLGISEIWMKKFQDLTISQPNWYISNRPFNFFLFNASFNRSMTSISTTMVSRPASTGRSGGGFGGGGGGGFSGGGFGGGGGHSR